MGMMGQEMSTRASVQRYARIFIIYCSFSNFALSSIQTQREGRNPFPSYFVPHRHNEKESPPSHCVTFHTDVTRRGVPPPTMLPSTQMRKEGESLPVMFCSTQTQ